VVPARQATVRYSRHEVAKEAGNLLWHSHAGCALEPSSIKPEQGKNALATKSVPSKVFRKL
jgi:hypothetical protein